MRKIIYAVGIDDNCLLFHTHIDVLSNDEAPMVKPLGTAIKQHKVLHFEGQKMIAGFNNVALIYLECVC